MIKSCKLVLLGITLVLMLTACAYSPSDSTLSSASTPTAFPTILHNPGIADLLRNPPSAGKSVEVDAYYSGAWGFPFSGGPPPDLNEIVCPFNWASALTDQPIRPFLQVLNATIGNGLSDDALYLVAVNAEGTRPGVRTMPQLPYHARLRGHLGDPTFAHCKPADRIFFVEDVVKVYEQEPPDQDVWMRLPKDFDSWQRYHDSKLGYNLPYPPGWQIAHPDDTTLELHAPRWEDYPFVVRVYPYETTYDQYQPNNRPPLMQGTQSWSNFNQNYLFSGENIATQQLDGSVVDRDAHPNEHAMSVLLSENNRTYELTLRFPTGVNASQEFLTDLTAIVAGFRLDVPPVGTPTPPIKQSIGTGPFLSQDEALAHAQTRSTTKLELLSAQLVSEAEARQQALACETFFGHPDGVWLLLVQTVIAERTKTMRLFIDAKTGEQLCGEEIPPTIVPYPLTR